MRNVRYWHKADIPLCIAHVRYWGSGHGLVHCTCPLLTQSGHGPISGVQPSRKWPNAASG